MFSKHSLSFSAFDDLITGTAFALLSEICFLENLTAFLTWESQLCLQAGITTGFFPLSPMFCCLFTATVGVKMLSSPRCVLTKRSKGLYNMVKQSEQKRKEWGT